MIDKSKLPSGLRVQMVWAPETNTDPEDRPIALVRDSKRFWISAIPMLIAFLVGSAIALLTTQRLLFDPVAAGLCPQLPVRAPGQDRLLRSLRGWEPG